jgi:lipopolysaccharide assembly outer membrane protein LptD (OstA)
LLKTRADTVSTAEDTTLIKSDTAANDTSKIKKKKKKEEFSSQVTYTARDSVAYSQDYSKFYLYGDVKINYEDIELKAAYVEYDLPKKMVFASGIKDSTGQYIGKPEFKKGKETFKSDSLYYNFITKKGIIRNIITEQEGGFLHAEKTKREADGTINIKNGEYTTCNADHPHFYLALTRGIVIPDKKIVSGPAYLVLEDIPLPIAIPFGFFPNKRGATSGIIMPSFGQSSNRGFSLTNGGYYWAASKYFDLALTGDVYSKGSWGLNVNSRYVKKYKYSGNFMFRYYITKTGTIGIHTGTDAEQTSKDRSITWSHSQDPKSNPTSHFSASVNYSSTKYNQNVNYMDPQAMVTSAKSSSIAYSKSWTNFNLTMNLHGSQSHSPSGSNLISLGLPNLSFNANRIYPFKSKDASGVKKWYEDININYSAQLDNNLSAKEDTIFTKTGWKDTWKRKTFGFRHSVPLSTNFKVLKYFNITPSISYTAMLYDMHINKRVVDSITNPSKSYVKTDTIHGFSYAQGFAPTLSASFNPTFYGTFAFGKNTKIRHVLTPTVSFSFIPGLKDLVSNYNRSIPADTARHILAQTYSIYSNNTYGTPTSSATHSGTFSFGIGNNLEMKVKSDKDTVTGTKKIVLIQSFSISSGYDIYAKERGQLGLSQISMSGSSPIFKNFNVTYNGNIDPYDVGVLGHDTTIYYWQKHHKIGRLTNAGISFGYTFTGGNPKTDANQSKTAPGAQTQQDKDNEAAKNKKPKADFDYFKIPWSLTFAYNLNYSKFASTSQTIQSLTVNGNFSLTPKLKFNFNTGYDFKYKKIIPSTSFSIQRDLHCWVMSLNVTPIGPYKIAVLSSFLNDLKYEQHKNFYDYQGYNNY